MTRSFTRPAGWLALAACIAAFAPAQARQAHEHGHGHAQQADAQMALDHGRQWATDAPLREGMSRIRTAVATATAHAHGLDAQKAQALADAVEGGIGFMVQNCRLKPEADANLHVLLGRLGAAASAVRADPKSPEGLPRMLAAIQAYPRYFEHPGWQAIGHAH